MADFEKAFLKTMGHEGKYSDDPRDRGGETYRGIARRFHPHWPGWSLIDRVKGTVDWFEKIKGQLEGLVRDFYRKEFWDKVLGDRIPSQAVAEELFDTGVNTGQAVAVAFLQRALNALNRNQVLYPDVVADGIMGEGTLTALTAYLKKDPEEYLLTLMNCEQGYRYMRIMQQSPDQERFARGWLSRVKLSKS
jgi:lysozyme family protein